MPPATRFTLNNFKWHLADPSDAADTKHLQSLFDTLKDAVAKIDEAQVLSGEDTNETSSRATVIATRKPMPMARSFDYDIEEGVPEMENLMTMKDILNAEQELANSMLAAINNDTITNFLQQFGFATDTPNQTFRREALKRCALRQALTEDTDAAFRELGYLQVRSDAADKDWDLMHWTQGLSDAQIRILQMQERAGEDRDERIFAFLNELFSLSIRHNKFETLRIARWCRVPTRDIIAWFVNRWARRRLPFILYDLPHKGFQNIHVLEYRIRNGLRANMTPKDAEPDWWPFQPEKVAENEWGVYP